MSMNLADLQARIVNAVNEWCKENPTAKVETSRTVSLVDRTQDGEWAGFDVGPQELFTVKVTDSEREGELADAFYLKRAVKERCPPAYSSGK